MKPGDVIAGRFELGELAGSGGMGRVYRARDLEADCAVAVKILARDAERHRARFAREAELLDRLRHPAIVRYIAHGVAETGELFLAMQWLDGEDLARRLARGALSVADTLALARRVLAGLAAAHALGVIHRDVKPRNVYLEGGAPERAMLLDFGIARMRDAVMTQTGNVIGTVGYMAPEQARAARDLDARADVFAAGCVLFECLAGQPAFQGDHAVAVLAKIIYDDPPRLSTIRGDVPAALDDLLAAAMAKRPDDRPADAGALDRALAAIGEPAGFAADAPRAALTEREQRRLYVILGAGPQDLATLADGSTLPDRDLGALHRRLEHETRAFGVHVEVLADGAAVATLTGGSSAADDAVAAARSALAIHRVLPDIPIALATGSGNLAGGLPVGEVVDRAALLLRDARPAIWTDDAMAALLAARFDIDDRTGGFELRRERDPAEAIHTLMGVPSPCVGRDREIAALDACFRECAADGIARAVVVTGAPGIGKSRLLREHIAGLERAEPRPELWIARGDPMSAAATFGMLAQLVRRAAGIHEGEPAAVSARKLCERVQRNAPARGAHVIELLAEVAGVPAEEVARIARESSEPGAAPARPRIRSARHDAVSLGDQMRGAFRDFVAAECAVRPVVIVLEDLHWGDAATIKALDEALRDLRERPLLVVAAARPEVHDLFPRLWAGRSVTRLELDVLPRRAAERLVRTVLGDAVPAAVVDKVLALAAGNAFYLEELIRAVAGGRTDGLPDTVLAMVDARIETLDAEHRRVLRAAGVFGEVFWRAGVAALLGADAPRGLVDAILADLRDHEMIERRPEPRFLGHDEYGFRHDLVREAAYRRLTAADRVLGHCLAGDWLERAGERDASVLAEHFDKGGAPARAVPHYLRASQDAMRGSSFDRGIALAERGVACGAAGTQLGVLRMVQTEAYAIKLELVDCSRTGGEALGLLAPGTGEWFSAVGAVMMACALRGDRERAERLLDELITTEPQPGAMMSCMLGYCWTMMVLAFSGLYPKAGALLVRAERLAARLAPGDRAVEAFVAQLRWWAACTEDQPWHRLVLARHAAALSEQAGYAFRTRAYTDLGASLATLGAYDEADRAFLQGLEIAERIGTVHGITVLRLHRSAALVECGRLDAAEPLVLGVLQVCAAAGDLHYAGRAHIYLASLRARRGELDAAEREARRATDYPHVRPIRAYASAMLASVLLAQGRPGDAVDAALDARRLFETVGGVYEGDTRIHLAVAEALTATGHADAAAARSNARARLLARAATIDDPALRASFLAVDASARTLALPP